MALLGMGYNFDQVLVQGEMVVMKNFLIPTSDHHFLQAAWSEFLLVGDCARLGHGPVRADGGVRGARQVRQLRPRRSTTHTLLPGVRHQPMKPLHA